MKNGTCLLSLLVHVKICWGDQLAVIRFGTCAASTTAANAWANVPPIDDPLTGRDINLFRPMSRWSAELRRNPEVPAATS